MIEKEKPKMLPPEVVKEHENPDVEAEPVIIEGSEEPKEKPKLPPSRVLREDQNPDVEDGDKKPEMGPGPYIMLGAILTGIGFLSGTSVGYHLGKKYNKPQQVYVTQLNEDDKPDVVVTSRLLDQASVWLGQEDELCKKLDDVEAEMSEKAVDGVKDYIDSIREKVELKYQQKKESKDTDDFIF